MFNMGGQEILILLILVGLLFGAKKLPELGRSVGEGLREFKKSMKEVDDKTPKDNKVG